MEITIKTSEPLLGFKTKHRQKINFHDFRFWYKAILGIGILTLVKLLVMQWLLLKFML